MDFDKGQFKYCVTPLIIVLVLTYCTILVSATENSRTGTSELSELIEIFTEDRAIMSRTFNLPFNENHYQRWKKFYSEWQDKLSGINFEKLDIDGRIDFLLLKNCILYEKSRLDIEKQRNDAIEGYLPFAKDIITLEENRRSMKRIKPEEHAKTSLIKNLSPLADLFISDAFATAHRSHASIVGFTAVLPSVAGRIMENELKSLGRVAENPEKPF